MNSKSKIEPELAQPTFRPRISRMALWFRYRVWLVMVIAAVTGSGLGFWWVRLQRLNPAELPEIPDTEQPEVKLVLPIPARANSPWQIQQSFTGVGRNINSLAISPDGSTLASSSDFSRVNLWDLNRICTGQECATPKQTLPMYSLWVYDVGFTSNGQYVVGGSWELVKIWEVDTGKLLNYFRAHFGSLYAIALGRQTSLLATASSDQTVKVWDLLSGKLQWTFTGHRTDVRALVISQDEKILASGSKGGEIKVWSLERPCQGSCDQPILTLSGHSQQINALAITPDRRYLISAGADQNVKVWNLTTGKLIRSFLAHEGTVLSLGLSPDGLTFATGGADQKIRIWDTASGTLLDVLSGHNGAVKSLVFRRDGKVLVSGGNDRRINVWQLIAKP